MLGPAPAITMLLILITQKSVFYAITIKDVEVNIQKSLITLLLFTPKAIKRIKGLHCYSTSNLSNNNNNNKFKIFMGIIIFLISNNQIKYNFLLFYIFIKYFLIFLLLFNL